MAALLKFRTPSTVTSYKTSDGREFNSKEEADQHQAILDFEGWYGTNALKGATAAETLIWLRGHAETLSRVLHAFKNARRV